MTAVDVDPRRAARAAEALRDGDVRIEAGKAAGVYRVRSFSQRATYEVRLNGERSCTCPDSRFRGTETCKHIAAILLAGGETV